MTPGFNGAAHSRARKCGLGIVGLGDRSASMGPRTLVRGNFLRNPYVIEKANMLQWGRALSCAEIVLRLAPPVVGRSLQWGRALSCAEIDFETEEAWLAALL